MIGRLANCWQVALRSAGRVIPAIPVPGFDRSKQFRNGRTTLLLGFVPGGVERYFVRGPEPRRRPRTSASRRTHWRWPEPAKAARPSERTAMTASSPRAHDRRTFLRGGAVLGATLAAAAAGSPAAMAKVAEAFGPIDRDAVTPGDIAILRFLAAAELLEDDLWQQYCELAVANPSYNKALRRIDRSLIRYVCDDRDDERSHAAFINSFLAAIDQEPINLDPFRTLPSVDVPGAEDRGRLTNLTRLTVDTSWYARYRSADNPDFGATFPQLVEIQNRPTIPTRSLSQANMQGVAHSAAFHFAAIEQGGSSLYCSLIPKASSLDVLRILAAIGPT